MPTHITIPTRRRDRPTRRILTGRQIEDRALRIVFGPRSPRHRVTTMPRSPTCWRAPDVVTAAAFFAAQVRLACSL